MPTWLIVLLSGLVIVGILVGVVVAIIAVYLHLTGNDKRIRIAFPSGRARAVAKKLNGTFIPTIGKVFQGSFSVVGDAHAQQHFVALEDDFERHCSEHGVWGSWGVQPFSTGANRYILNYVRIPRPYGTVAAYEFRFDDPTVDWHLVMVYDISPATGVGDDERPRNDARVLLDNLRNAEFQSQAQMIEYEGHLILLLSDCRPQGLKGRYTALREC